VTDVPGANVVSPDAEDVRLLAGLLFVLKVNEVLAARAVAATRAAVALLGRWVGSGVGAGSERGVELAGRCQVAAQGAKQQCERDCQVLDTEHRSPPSSLE